MPIVCVIGIAVFVVLCAVFGRNKGAEPEEASPTEAPFFEVVEALQKKFGGDITRGDNFSSLSYRSESDGKFATANAYLKSGVICMSLTHPFESVKVKTTPEPTEDIFGNTPKPTEQVNTGKKDEYVEKLSDELLYCFTRLYMPPADDDAYGRIGDALTSLRSSEVKKVNVIFGIYLLKFSFSDDDGLLTVTCEPA